MSEESKQVSELVGYLKSKREVIRKRWIHPPKFNV
jgi:hypothetical protein